MTPPRRFAKEDLVANPPFFYWANLEHPVWDVTFDEADRDDADVMIALAPEDCPPLGIITTQSCDLAEPEPKRPWFCLAPVVEIGVFGAASSENIRAQKYGYLHALPEVPGRPGSGWLT